MRTYGLHVRGAKKGPDSVEYGIHWLQGLDEIMIDDKRCPNAAREFIGYELDRDARGEFKAGYPDHDNHCLTGDTLVSTPDGDFRIDELVGKSGQVYCYDEQSKIRKISTFRNVSHDKTECKNIRGYAIRWAHNQGYGRSSDFDGCWMEKTD
jgi:phage terminase large subunit